MNSFSVFLGLATLLCSLVAGFVLAFALVVMPGIRDLKDREFLQAFKVMDSVIQNNQPLFAVVWLGSIVTLAIATGIGIFQLEGVDRTLLILAAVIYFAGTQWVTFTKNVPLNNALQIQNIDTCSEADLAETRKAFETQWMPWNARRTFFAIIAVSLLLFLIFRI